MVFGGEQHLLMNVVCDLAFDLGFLENGKDRRCLCLVKDDF